MEGERGANADASPMAPAAKPSFPARDVETRFLG